MLRYFKESKMLIWIMLSVIVLILLGCNIAVKKTGLATASPSKRCGCDEDGLNDAVKGECKDIAKCQSQGIDPTDIHTEGDLPYSSDCTNDPKCSGTCSLTRTCTWTCKDDRPQTPSEEITVETGCKEECEGSDCPG